MNRPKPPTDSSSSPSDPSSIAAEDSEKSDFIRDIVAADLRSGKHQTVVTRFPPEPNGYLHIGHAKSICLNFGIAAENNGVCHLRFDDTNPLKEDADFVEAIERDVRWLGFTWSEKTFHASDYFDQFYLFAQQLIRDGKAYVDSSSEEDIRKHRGTVTEAGSLSPFRDRSVEENLTLLQGMRNGEFEDGRHVLRARIDMASPNMKMRDPLIYRIRNVPHHRTSDQWHIYPMYDFAHCLSDAIEGVTHSLCTLEFENNREVYDWFLKMVNTECRPQQIEFARLNIDRMVMSKRKLLELVEDGVVDGWDDPRMPTLAGLRRRGYTPGAIRAFCERVGIAKRDNKVDHSLLEYHIREDLNRNAQRVMGVLRPLKVVITNYPEGQVEQLPAINNPENSDAGSRDLPFGRELYIEQDDFREEPPKKYFRLGPDREVRLKHAYFIKCHEFIKDDAGNIVELRCTYDPETKSGTSQDGRKVKGTLHWVSANHSIDAEVRLYDHLFEELAEDTDSPVLNPSSKVTLTQCKMEPGLATSEPGDHFQFMRTGYFTVDVDSVPGKIVFNRTVSLKDTWAKMQKKAQR